MLAAWLNRDNPRHQMHDVRSPRADGDAVVRCAWRHWSSSTGVHFYARSWMRMQSVALTRDTDDDQDHGTGRLDERSDGRSGQHKGAIS